MIPNLIIPKTKETPRVEFLFNKFSCLIEGDSIPENPFEFYYPIINTYEDFIKAYNKELPKEVEFIFDMHYFNSASLKMIYVFFEKINHLNALNKLQTKVSWMLDEIDDEDLMENISHIEELTEVKIHQTIKTH